MTDERIVLDVWGGEHSMEHIARHLPTLGDTWRIAERELRAGYLINLRSELEWGAMTPFDARVGIKAEKGLLQ